MSKNKNIIVGYSGHSFSVIDAVMESGKKVFFYSEKKEKTSNPFNLEYLGFEGHPKFKGWEMDLNFILGIGNNRLRESIGSKIISLSKNLLNVIHPNTFISKTSTLGNGIFISSGTNVNSNSKIGDFVILNTGSIIEHECVLGKATSISPGAVLCGNVEVGERVLIGANSVIKEGVKIGDDSIIGAGSVIINDVIPNSIVVGNPGKKLYEK